MQYNTVMMLGGSSKSQLPVRHALTRVNKQYSIVLRSEPV